MSLKKARDLMTKNPVCITPETTVQEAAGLMESLDVGSLPVVDSSQRFVGIVTDRDLALRVVARGGSSSLPVSGVMSSNDLASVQPDADLDEVEKLMGRRQVRRIPVVDEQGRVAGMIAQADLARERKAVGEGDFGKVMEEISEPVGAR